jgi:hypothetical protein
VRSHCLLVALLALLALLASCGGRIDVPAIDIPPAAALPSALYVDDDGCAKEVAAETAATALTPVESGEGVAVVEIAYAEECTGLGGQYILAREVDGFISSFWLGSHGCNFLAPGLVGSATTFGVLRYRVTAALFEIPVGVCVSFPGEPDGFSSDSWVQALAVFPTLEAAALFAKDLE